MYRVWSLGAKRKKQLRGRALVPAECLAAAVSIRRGVSDKLLCEEARAGQGQPCNWVGLQDRVPTRAGCGASTPALGSVLVTPGLQHGASAFIKEQHVNG